MGALADPLYLAHQDDDDDDDGSAADSEDEEAVQLAQRQKLLNEEIRDLEAAVAKKRVEIEKSANVIIRVRLSSPRHELRNDRNAHARYLL